MKHVKETRSRQSASERHWSAQRVEQHVLVRGSLRWGTGKREERDEIEHAHHRTTAGCWSHALVCSNRNIQVNGSGNRM